MTSSIFKTASLRTAVFMFSALFLLCGFAGRLHAEAVFLKDGAVVEGKILSENDDKVTLELANKSKFSYSRKDIIRVLYHNDYRVKKYLTKNDGTVLEVYLVDEKRDSYTYRTSLMSVLEVTISKDEVESVSKKKPSGKTIIAADQQPDKNETPKKESSAKKTDDASEARPTATLVRIGGNLALPKLDFATSKSVPTGFMADVFFLRLRNDSGNGMDLFARGQFNQYNKLKDTKLGLPEMNGYTLLNESKMNQFSAGAGARFGICTNLGGIQLQGYALAYYQYSKIKAQFSYLSNSSGEKGTKDYSYDSHGAVGGAGVEMSLRYAGLFAEYTWGYSPAFEKKTSIESGMFRAGVTIRTPLL